MPPVPSSLKRMTANPSKPARHRPGKAVPEEESSEEEEDEEEQVEAARAPVKAKPQTRPNAPRVQAAIHDDEDDDDDDEEEGFVTEDEDNVPAKGPSSTMAKTAPSKETAAKPSGPVSLRSDIAHPPPLSKGNNSEDDSSASGSASEEDSDAESDSSSSPEPPQRKLLRPTFIKKTDRKAAPEATSTVDQPMMEDVDHSSATPGPSVISATTVNTHDRAARRLDEAEALIKQRIERDTLARLQGRKNWDDDDDLPAEALVDDTDGLDPAAEHSAWRLREMHRLKRDREALIAREKEIEEVERRRGLTAEEREKEDRAHLDQQKAARDSREQAGYLAKYHHKGAFFMDEDDEAAKKLRERQFAGARFQDEVADKSTLPEYLRVRDGTKVGKKGRTRYTDLKGEDTGRWGDDVKRWKGSGYGNDRRADGDAAYDNVDERFRPDGDRGDGPSASGANASQLGQRRRRSRSRSRRSRSRDSEAGDSCRPERRRRRSYSRSRSRSRSPRRSRTPPYRSRRSPSLYSDRDREKRRRIEA